MVSLPLHTSLLIHCHLLHITSLVEFLLYVLYVFFAANFRFLNRFPTKKRKNNNILSFSLSPPLSSSMILLQEEVNSLGGTGGVVASRKNEIS